MTIPKPERKIKPWGLPGQGILRIAMEALVFLLVLCAAFLMGRISAVSGPENASEIQVIYPPLVAAAAVPFRAPKTSHNVPESLADTAVEPGEPDVWSYAASKSGKVYYPRDCGSLNRVKPENRVYFTSSEQAEAAGYDRSSACAE